MAGDVVRGGPSIQSRQFQNHLDIKSNTAGMPFGPEDQINFLLLTIPGR